MKRTEIDHLTTIAAFNALGAAGTAIGLGYNAGGVSYDWTMRKLRGGSVEIVIAGELTLTASLHDVTRAARLPVCAFVSSVVQKRTGNCAVTLCDLCPSLGR